MKTAGQFLGNLVLFSDDEMNIIRKGDNIF